MCGAGAAIFGFTDSLANPPFLPGEDPAALRDLAESYRAGFQPAGQVAEDLVERMAAGGVVDRTPSSCLP
jgi:hypothetical protein